MTVIDDEVAAVFAGGWRGRLAACYGGSARMVRYAQR